MLDGDGEITGRLGRVEKGRGQLRGTETGEDGLALEHLPLSMTLQVA